MKVPRTPNPPKLPDDLSDLELAKKEIQAFRAAAKSRKCGSPIPQMTDEELVKSKYYKRLVDAAHAHQDHEIAPMAWCAFAIDAWRDKQRQRRRRGDQPAFGFVFSANFIREKRGWFRSQAGNYGGGRPQVSPECRDVQNRWRAATTFYRRARHQLLETGTTRDYGAPDELTPEGVKAFLEQIEFELFETHFPGGWEGWYEKAIAANEAYAEKLKIAVARGEFVWST